MATGRNQIADSGVMLRVVAYAASQDIRQSLRTPKMKDWCAMLWRDQAKRRVKLGLTSGPARAEAMAIARDLALVEKTGAAIHFRQVTTGTRIGPD
ncbi:MAG: dihydroorotase, partial [Sphingomonadales bacterium]|nr:dihydroorotase [Sphingomonadales bacterium]